MRIMAMKRQEMTEIVNVELEHIPKGDLPQKLLRYLYNMVRRNHLAATKPISKEDTLSSCIRRVKVKHPDFQPEYDKTFFVVA